LLSDRPFDDYMGSRIRVLHDCVSSTAPGTPSALRQGGPQLEARRSSVELRAAPVKRRALLLAAGAGSDDTSGESGRGGPVNGGGGGGGGSGDGAGGDGAGGGSGAQRSGGSPARQMTATEMKTRCAAQVKRAGELEAAADHVDAWPRVQSWDKGQLRSMVGRTLRGIGLDNAARRHWRGRVKQLVGPQLGWVGGWVGGWGGVGGAAIESAALGCLQDPRPRLRCSALVTLAAGGWDAARRSMRALPTPRRWWWRSCWRAPAWPSRTRCAWGLCPSLSPGA
jgi:hypothetical protein